MSASTARPREDPQWLKLGLAWGWWLLMLTTVALQASSSAPRMALSVTDAVAGLVILIILRWRRRYPVTVAISSLILASVSMSGLVGELWAVASIASSRRWRPVGLVAGVSLLVSGPLTMWMARYGMTADSQLPPAWEWALAYGVWQLGQAIAFGLGIYTGTRRDLLRSYQERAELAEQQRRLEVASAQAEERNRIAREMHDVVAHRISLIAVQASALRVRDDLSRDESRELADTIATNARQALDELRSVLGSLRNVDPSGALAKPQPTLAELPALLADARDAGQRIDDHVDVDLSQVPAQLSRHAFRVVQEGLTNARKHASGTVVSLVVQRADDGLAIQMTNPLRVGPSVLPGSGQGLVGVRERVQLVGGRFEAGRVGGEFELKVWMPWPSES